MSPNLSVPADRSTLPEILRASVERFGPNPLFGTKSDDVWTWTSYTEFAVLVNEMREILSSLGVQRGDRVAIIAPNCLKFAVGAYAAFDLGASLVAMYENQTDANWEYIIRDCGAKVLLVSTAAVRERVAAFQERLPQLRDVMVIAGAARMPVDATRHFAAFLRDGRGDALPTDIATIIYTSGTTGEPKGVPLTHANICANVNTVRKLFPLGPSDRSMSFLPWAHIFGQVVEMHCMMSLGASVGICESTEKIVANLAEVQPTILFSVPRIYEKIYDGVHKQMAEKPSFIQRIFAAGMTATAAPTPPTIGQRLLMFVADALIFSKIRAKFGGRLRFAISGGASLSKDVAKFIDALGIQVYEAYGLTETGCISTNTPNTRKMGGVGRPIEGVRITLDTSVTDDATQGEIVVSGPSIMSGYFNRPDATAEAILPDGSFRTGDLGRIDADGHLFITGRIKEQYKLANGKYVAPAPLEDQLKLSPFISNVMIYGDNRTHNVALIAVDGPTLAKWLADENMAISPDVALSHEKVRALFAQELERYSTSFHSYERIRAFAFAEGDFTQENGMLTPTFKLKRRTIMARYGALIESLYK